MTSTGNIAAVIPAYNEEKTIGSVVRGLLPHTPCVIVVNDRSVDATRKEAEEAGAVVLDNTGEKGYDGAINAGFAEAKRRGATVIFTFDADGEHDASDVPYILAPILSGKADIVAGQRPHTTHWGEKVFALYTGARYGIWDPLCGFKAYRANVYDAVGYFDSVQSIGTELMLGGLSKGFKVALVPIILRTREGDSSRFYQQSLRANFKIIKAMFRVLFA